MVNWFKGEFERKMHLDIERKNSRIRLLNRCDTN